MKNIYKRFSIPFVVVVVLIVIVGGVYYLKSKKSEIHITPEIPHSARNVIYQTPENINLTGIYEINDWETYVNDKFGYEFQHPQDFNLLSQDYGDLSINTVGNIFVHSGKYGRTAEESDAHFEFEVEVLQPGATNTNITLLEYAESKWLLNKYDANPNIGKNKKVGNMESVIIDGHRAYKFDVTTSYASGRGGYLLNEETTFLFTEANSNIYTIKYPTNNNLNSRKILSTFKFTK